MDDILRFAACFELFLLLPMAVASAVALTVALAMRRRLVALEQAFAWFREEQRVQNVRQMEHLNAEVRRLREELRGQKAAAPAETVAPTQTPEPEHAAPATASAPQAPSSPVPAPAVPVAEPAPIPEPIVTPRVPPAAPSPESAPVAAPAVSAKAAAFERLVQQRVEMPPVAAMPPEPPMPAPPPAAPAAVAPLPISPPVQPPVAPATPAERQPEARRGAEWALVRVAIWVGGVAGALGGIYIVQELFRQGVINKYMCLAVALAFGVGVLLLGQWQRRTSRALAQAISAGGVATLFACFMIGANFPVGSPTVPPVAGFVCTVAVTALAVGLSLQLGPFVALVGLMGGFLTPILINTGSNSAPGLFGYLFLLQAGLMTVTRRRGWSWLAALTLLGSLGWIFVWMAATAFRGAPLKDDLHVVGLYVLGVVGTLNIAVTPAAAEARWRGGAFVARVLGHVGTVLGLLLGVLLLAMTDFSNTQWAYMGVMAAGCIVLGRLRSAYENLAWVAGVLGLGLLLSAGMVAHHYASVPFDTPRWTVLISLFGAIFTLGSWACLWGSKVPARWATLSVFAAVGYVLVGYDVIGQAPRPAMWALLPLGVAGLYGGLSWAVAARRAQLRTGEETLAVMLSGVLALVALAMPLALTQAWLTASLAVLIPAGIAVSLGLRVPALRMAVAVLVGIVAVRLLANPAIFTYDRGPALFWNPVVYGFGVPLLALSAGAWLLRKTREPLAMFCEALSALVAMAMLTLLVRRGFHPDDLLAAAYPQREFGTLHALMLAVGWLLVVLGRTWQRGTFLACGILALGLGVVATGVSLAAFVIPSVYGTIGPYPVANWLLLSYGAPLAVMTLAGIDLSRRGEKYVGLVLQMASLAVLFVLAAMFVRHGYGRTQDVTANVQFTELGTYAVVWLALGWGLMALGQWRQSRLLREGGWWIVAAGIMEAVVLAGVVFQPGWTHWDVGTTLIFNGLLYVYGMPAVLLTGIAVWLWYGGERLSARVVGVAAMVLTFGLLNFQVRQAFVGPHLDAAGLSQSELYTYSAAWTVFGTVLLVLGITLRGLVLRWASLVTLLLTAVKVFIVDTWHLEGLQRALSLLGLAVALFVLAFVYNRLVFRLPTRGKEPAKESV